MSLTLVNDKKMAKKVSLTASKLYMGRTEIVPHQDNNLNMLVRERQIILTCLGSKALRYVAFKASHKEVEIYPQLNVNPPMTYIFPQLKASHRKG